MSSKIRVTGPEIDIEACSLQEGDRGGKTRLNMVLG
jgi:hypothetical protein